jgi:hypothetical protein
LIANPRGGRGEFVLHAFTSPEANDKAFGTVYDPSADQRPHTALVNFADEIF